MKNQSLILLVVVLFSAKTNAQIISFTNTDLKSYLINEVCVDTNNDGFPDDDVDTNNDNEIQISEAESVSHLTIAHPGSTPPLLYTISEVSELSHFSNLKKLIMPGEFGLVNISNLNIDSLTHIDISNHSTIENIDLSGLPNLVSINITGLTGLKYLNVQNGSFATEHFSLFYTYFSEGACVDSIASEFNIVANHGPTPSINCSLNIDQDESDNITIAPNPTNSAITVQASAKIESIQIWDLKGKKIRVFGNNNLIDISDLNAGIYILRVSLDNEKTLIKKIIKN